MACIFAFPSSSQLTSEYDEQIQENHERSFKNNDKIMWDFKISRKKYNKKWNGLIGLYSLFLI